MVAPFTPFTKDGTVNLDLVEKYAERMIERGNRAFYVCGGTGEAMSLAADERMAVAERWRAVLSEDWPLVVQVGFASIEECKRLAAHAQEIGADAISSIGPTGRLVDDPDIVVAFTSEIAAAAPNLPFYYYHTGDLPSVKISGLQYLEATGEKIPTLAGIKHTNADLVDLSLCLRFENQKYEFLYGHDEMLLPALSVGAPIGIGGTYNLISPTAVKLMASFHHGDLGTAQTLQAKIQDFVRLLARFGGFAAIKSAMKMIGLDCGQARLPRVNMDPAKEKKLFAAVEALFPDLRS